MTESKFHIKLIIGFLGLLIFSSCNNISIKKEKEILANLNKDIEKLEADWSGFFNKTVFEDLDSMLIMVDSMKLIEPDKNLSPVQVEQRNFWIESSRRYQKYKSSYQELFLRIKSTKKKLNELESDRINRSVQRERFFLYIQDEQREIKAIRHNLNITIEALNGCHKSFVDYGTVLAELIGQEV